MVDVDGSTVSDLQAVPSPALMPALIPTHQRPVAKSLFDASKMEQWQEGRNQLTKQAIKSLREANEGGENVVPCYPMKYSGGRRVEIMMDPDCKKQQLLDLDSIASSLTHTNSSALLHFKAAKANRPCHCSLYLATSPPKPTLMVVWCYEDLINLGGEKPGGDLVPFVLSADLTFLFLMKFGDETPTVTKLRELASFQVPLDEAWIKLIGLCPSLQMKIYKESVNADLRAHMLREIYHLVMRSKRQHASVYASVQLQIPVRAMQRLNRVHHDPETSTVRPAGRERDPYTHMTAGMYHEILSEIMDRRSARFLHPFCKREDSAVRHDVPEDPLTLGQISREKKKAARVKYQARIETFLKERGVSSTADLKPEDIPSYRKSVFGEAHEVLPLITYQMGRGASQLPQVPVTSFSGVNHSPPSSPELTIDSDVDNSAGLLGCSESD